MLCCSAMEDILKFFILNYITLVFYLYVWMCECIEYLGTWVIDNDGAGMWVLGTDPSSSGRTANDHNHWVISLSLQWELIKRSKTWENSEH